jgi:hypothetical protein
MSTSYWISLTGQASAREPAEEIRLINNGFIRVGFLRWLVWSLSLQGQHQQCDPCPGCPYHRADQAPLPRGTNAQGIGIPEPHPLIIIGESIHLAIAGKGTKEGYPDVSDIIGDQEPGHDTDR